MARYLLAYRARANLDRKCWEDAVASATLILRNPRTSPVPRAVALAVVGLVRARRGDPEAWEPLDEVWALVRGTGELQRIQPVAAARAEAYRLEGRNDEVEEATALALELAPECGASWVVGEMLSWRRRAGGRRETVGAVPEPFAGEVAGDWWRACEQWRKLDAPYEAALALAEADDEAASREALEELHRLGARPAAEIVARRLLEHGASRLPRGPRPTTRANPAQLTARELEVLAFLAAGCQNHEIAERLIVSPHTVDHHVSAVFASSASAVAPRRLHRPPDSDSPAKIGSGAAHLGSDYRCQAPLPHRTVLATTRRQEDYMPRYMVERTFPDGLHIPVDDVGAKACEGAPLFGPIVMGVMVGVGRSTAGRTRRG